MEMMVTVYCLSFNHIKYIRDALNGFVNQKTTFPYEVIVHDDASTDGTDEIIMEYAKKYPKIIKPILQKKNLFAQKIDAFQNYILPKASGKYIAICEGDDYWNDENKLQMQVDFLEKHLDYVACVHNSYLLNVSNGKQTKMYKQKFDYDLTVKDVYSRGGQSYQTSSLMYRKQYAYSFPHYFTYVWPIGDYPLALYLATNGKIRFINKIMSTYRSGSDGSWSSRSRGKDTQISVFININKMLTEYNQNTEYKYSEMITKQILRNEYMINELNRNYSYLKNTEYANIWNDYPFIFRLKRFLKRKFGFLFQ